jgi:enoyl-[acyl-carrier protein] reductase II
MHRPPKLQNAVLKAKERSTVVTGISGGHPVRVLDNRLAKEFAALDRRGAPQEEFDRLGTGKLKAAAVNGDIENGSVMIGQVAA